MKCINCANEIPDASTICPFCNSKVEPVTSGLQMFNVTENTSAIPITPVTPVLPQDQGMPTQPVQPAQPIESVQQVPVQPVVQETVQPVAQPQPVVQEVVQPVAQPQPVVQEAVQPVAQPQPVVQEAVQPVAQPQPVAQEAVQPAQAQGQLVDEMTQQNGPTADMKANFIDPSGNVIEGGKIGSSKPVEPPKDKKKIIVPLILVFVILLIVGGGVFAYFYEFKSADKRINAVVNYLTKFTNSWNNQSIELTSGTYTLIGDVNVGDNEHSINAKGSYGIDLKNKVVDYTLDLENLKIEKELVDKPINFETYINSGKTYVLFENFFEKYIYEENPENEKIFDNIEQNDINYILMVNQIKNAMIQSFKSINYSQSVGKANLNGASKTVNIITFDFNEQNKNQFITSIANILTNDQTFSAEYEKIFAEKPEKVDEMINKMIDFVLKKTPLKDYKKYENIKLYFYSSLFKPEFEGIRITATKGKNNYDAELSTYSNGYALKVRKDNNSILEGTYTTKVNPSSKTVETTYTVEGTAFVKKEAYKGKFDFVKVKETNPSVSKANVKNSINKKYVTGEDILTIKSKARQAGAIGLYLPEYIDKYFGITDSGASVDAVKASVAGLYQGIMTGQISPVLSGSYGEIANVTSVELENISYVNSDPEMKKYYDITYKYSCVDGSGTCLFKNEIIETETPGTYKSTTCVITDMNDAVLSINGKCSELLGN